MFVLFPKFIWTNKISKQNGYFLQKYCLKTREIKRFPSLNSLGCVFVYGTICKSPKCKFLFRCIEYHWKYRNKDVFYIIESFLFNVNEDAHAFGIIQRFILNKMRFTFGITYRSDLIR